MGRIATTSTSRTSQTGGTIPQIAHTSGIGRYRAQVTLPAGWTAARHGAYLELGAVDGGVQVSVNGRRVSPASVAPARLDVGRFLRAGANAIEVELTTTLKNRMDSLADQPGFEYFAFRPQRTQSYGLLGPVRLVPYVDVPVERRPWG